MTVGTSEHVTGHGGLLSAAPFALRLPVAVPVTRASRSYMAFCSNRHSPVNRHRPSAADVLDVRTPRIRERDILPSEAATGWIPASCTPPEWTRSVAREPRNHATRGRGHRGAAGPTSSGVQQPSKVSQCETAKDLEPGQGKCIVRQ